jgi:predicted MFS family arabinose efflux permease
MLSATISFMVLPFSTMIPVYAKDIFKGTASTFGVIDSVIGLGAFSGAISWPRLNRGVTLKRYWPLTPSIFGAGLVIFSHMPSYPLALLFAAVTGFGMMSQITISNTLIQTTVSPDMRGRVISFYAMAFFGMQPLGGLLVGSVSQWIGTADTVMLEGIVALVIGILHFRFLRKTTLQKNTTHTLEQQPINTLS